MATGKGNGRPQGKGNMDWGGNVRNTVVRGADDRTTPDHNIPWSLLIAVVVLCLVLILVLPVMGLMYVDMNNATNMAIHEVRKMKELRLQILQER